MPFVDIIASSEPFSERETEKYILSRIRKSRATKTLDDKSHFIDDREN